jgi:hypothetical protein
MSESLSIYTEENSKLYQQFGHYWTYCNHCETDVVICGVCGNNCCNGGYGQVDGKTCEACPSAYQMQMDREKPYHMRTYLKTDIVNRIQGLEVDTGFK